MQFPALTDMVGQDKRVYFSFYRDGELWYQAENGFGFPIPREDMKGALFKPEDKSIFFMRFIKKHLEYLKGAWSESSKPEVQDIGLYKPGTK